jgi:hypothetical protein
MVTAQVSEARDLGMGIAENAYRFVSEKTGMPYAARAAAETRVKRWHGKVASAFREHKDAYAMYRQRTRAEGTPPMSTLAFRDAISDAGRNNDSHVIPEVATAARAYRKHVLNPMLDEAIKARLVDDMIRTVAHENMDMGVVRANRAALKDFQSEIRLASREDIRDVEKMANRQIALINTSYKVVIDALKSEAAVKMGQRLDALEGSTKFAKDTAKNEVAAEFDTRIAAVEAKRQKIVDGIARDKALAQHDMAATNVLYDTKLKALRAEQEELGKSPAAKPEALEALRERIRDIEAQRKTARVNMRELLNESLLYVNMKPAEATGLLRIKLDQLQGARAAELEAKLKPLDMADTVGRDLARREVNVEYRAAKRQMTKYFTKGEKIVEKEAKRQIREAKRDMKAQIREAADDFEAAGKLLTKGEVADAVVHAIARDIPDEYIAGEIADTLAKTKARIASPEFRNSYVPRVYNTAKIEEDGGAGLRAALVRYYVDAQEVPPEKAREMATDAWSAIMGGRHNIGVGSGSHEGIKATITSAQRERQLLVPDSILTPWLKNDMYSNVVDYARKMGARIELAKTSSEYGQVGAWRLTGDLNSIKQRYDEAILANPANAKKLGKERDQFLKDVETTADRLLGVYDVPHNPTHWAARMGSVVKNSNVMARMGALVFSSLSDVVQPVVALGLSRSYGVAIAGIMNGTLGAALKMNARQIRELGTALDLVQPYFTRVPDEMGDSLGKVGAVAQAGTHLFGRWGTGFAAWNTGMKMLSATLIQNDMLKMVAKVSAGNATARDLSDLAKLGIDANMARRMAAEPMVQKGNITLADLDAWRSVDTAAAFQSALVKGVDSMIITAGVGDTAGIIKGPLLKLVAQFQTFNMAAHNRALVPLLQDPDWARKISGLSSSVAIGAMVHVVRETYAGRGEQLQKAIDDGDYYNLARGVAGNVSALTLTMMADQMIGGALGLEGTGRYASAQTVVGQLGPTFGAAESAYRLAKAAGPGEFTEASLHTARGLLPFQNTPWMNVLLNPNVLGIETGNLEKRAAEALDLKERKQ